jgi:hypothetical protein
VLGPALILFILKTRTLIKEALYFSTTSHKYSYPVHCLITLHPSWVNSVYLFLPLFFYIPSSRPSSPLRNDLRVVLVHYMPCKMLINIKLFLVIIVNIEITWSKYDAVANLISTADNEDSAANKQSNINGVMALVSRPLLALWLGEYWFRISCYVYDCNRPLAPILRQRRCSLIYDVYWLA